MADFTAKDVQNLRQITGAGMMDAKKALTENDGDFEVLAGHVYQHDGHNGKSHARKLRLTDEDGTVVECWLRGGVLCVD